MFRLETRAREIAVMASLTFYKGKAKGNRICAFFHQKKEAMDLKGSKVMAVRLETGRSSPG